MAHLQNVSMSALKYARLFEGSYLRLAQWCFSRTGSRWSSFSAELNPVQAQLIERLVQFYQALGGGWQQ